MLALVYSTVHHFMGLHPAAPWWRKRELVTDIVSRSRAGVRRVFRIGLMVLGASVVFDIHDADDLIAFYDDGHARSAQLPLWCRRAVSVAVGFHAVLAAPDVSRGGSGISAHPSFAEDVSGSRPRASTRDL